MSNENIEEYVEFIEKEKCKNPENPENPKNPENSKNSENEEDLKGIAINCVEATFNWDKNQVWISPFFSRFLQILLFIFRTI
jgi:hypothetical protein